MLAFKFIIPSVLTFKFIILTPNSVIYSLMLYYFIIMILCYLLKKYYFYFFMAGYILYHTGHEIV